MIHLLCVLLLGCNNINASTPTLTLAHDTMAESRTFYGLIDRCSHSLDGGQAQSRHMHVERAHFMTIVKGRVKEEVVIQYYS